ncbi:hypothetical protein GCM10011363_00030 [Marivita lacus]|uniref:Uncharacterized protein n=1 Tax=Marivita lacus TaxID=1323742 RepID=A0ABQ1K9S5_9RHOB|nr:hypothetical protein [Marivita lacus]GGB87389.1 hypothetical protein GCM10011363_00030 [Marivita lacus]
MKKFVGMAAGSARWVWRLVFVSIFALSLMFNVVAVFGGALFSAVSAAVGSVTGARTLIASHADEIAELNTDLVAERRVQRELRTEVADLSGNLAVARTANRELREQVTELGEDMATSRLALRQARSEITDLTDNIAAERLATRQLREEIGDGLVDFGGRRIALRDAVGETADTVSSRAAKSATRETASMAGEALPYVGTAVIVGVTALEISDLCQTIRDMNALKRAFNPSLAPSEEELTVCSMPVPSRQELWNATVSAPGAAWEYSKDAVPKLEDLKSFELPSRQDLWALWSGIRAGVAGRWGDGMLRGKELYDWVVE